jgi:hypothetical protein
MVIVGVIALGRHRRMNRHVGNHALAYKSFSNEAQE